MKSKPEIKAFKMDLDDLKGADKDALAALVDEIGDDMDMPDDIKQELQAMIKKVVDEVGEPFKCMADAQEAVIRDTTRTLPPKGALVTRTKEGEKVYKFPSGELEDDFEAAIVADVWDHYAFDKHGKLANGVIAVASGRRGVRMYAVDLRMYETAKVG